MLGDRTPSRDTTYPSKTKLARDAVFMAGEDLQEFRKRRHRKTRLPHAPANFDYGSAPEGNREQ